MPDREPQSAPQHETGDVATILEQLRAEVRRHRETLTTDDEQHTAFRTTSHQMQRCAEQLEITRLVSAHWPLEHNNLLTFALTLVHRVVRRALRWYINPIVEQQNGFNDVASRSLRLLIDGYVDLANQVAELQHEQHAAPAHHTPPHAGAWEAQRSTAPDPDTTPDTEPPAIAELQMLVATRATTEPPATFPDLTLPPQLPHMAAQKQVQAHWELQGQPVVVLVQRLIRRYLRWLINPIVEQQNMFNQALTAAVAPTAAADAHIRPVVAALRAKRLQRHRHEHGHEHEHEHDQTRKP